MQKKLHLETDEDRPLIKGKIPQVKCHNRRELISRFKRIDERQDS